MRVGLLTFHFCDNYGAVLQAYALQAHLQSLGHDVAFIDYRPSYMTKGGRLRLPRSKRDLFANATVLFIRLSRLRAVLTGVKRDSSFRDFIATHLRFNGPLYESYEDLIACPPECDAYICGSDQIWNPPPRAGVDPAYYLAFGSTESKRISYAASFGGASVDSDYEAEICRLLSGLDSISVREQSGVDLVKKLAGRDAVWVPDPTMLLDDYSSVLAPPPDGDYVFSYSLRTGAMIGEVQKEVSQACQAPVLTPYNAQQRWRSGGTVVHLGPAQWLGCISGARFVVTNSFHGTLFSILFRKPFITTGLVGRNVALNERFRSVLGRLGLQERFMADYDPEKVARLLKKPILWEDVAAKLEAWRAEAKQFLAQAL